MKRYLLILTVFFAAACGSADKKAAEKAPEKEGQGHEHEEDIVEITDAQAKTIGLTLETLQPRKLSGSIKVNGMLDVPPQQMLSVSTPYGGILRNTGLLEGSWVRKGQVIAEMEHPDYIQLQQDYLETKTQLGFLDQEYVRQEELSREEVTAKKTFQKTDAERKTLKVRLEGLRQKLTLLHIHFAELDKGNIVRAIPIVAPISGYVTKVNANIGKYVPANEPMFEIVDTEHLHAELTVFEKDIPRLKIGRKVRFLLSNETKERTATVHLIGREIDRDRTIRVHCHLDREDREMMPGTFLKAWVETGAAEVASLPAEAVVMEGERQYVFVAEKAKNHFKRLAVMAGVTEDGYTEVSLPAGVDAGAQFVVKGATDLMSKMTNGEESGHSH
ncbi:efflux RND transporter periplasmic adaptor subunit [Chitinophaga deserti]|uniref:efflux RND transporter periplasmic adaptor subunit n=1 Tax=Chitinophaga deserti TaxID=2164099 RepID=UPI000D6BE9E5|nr:efflux RND transporter periplasmic adaptor subunit [Chitinophaga deserti]